MDSRPRFEFSVRAVGKEMKSEMRPESDDAFADRKSVV